MSDSFPPEVKEFLAQNIHSVGQLEVLPKLRSAGADDLNTALKRFTELNLDELPVVSADASSELLGMLRRREVIACYNDKLHEFQRQARDEGIGAEKSPSHPS